ncbi:MAG: ACP S-malonyltransferase [Fimbriimonas sp.]|nr:ACP S-malonyltransferase [Fimbriimonas sp.]
MIAAIFPGQGSQTPGMGKDVFDASNAAREVFENVSTTLGFDVAKLCFESDEETLRATNNAQIALYTVGVASYAASEFAADVFAGHSIGEYAALVCSGTLSLEDGARLVQKRGELMASAGDLTPGTMAAVLGLEIPTITETLAKVDGIVVVANDNCPGQTVISGAVEAVASAIPLLQEAGAKRVLPLNVSGAFHSPLMTEPSRQMAQALANAVFQKGKPVYANVTTRPIEDPSDWRTTLEQQLRDQVRWTDSVRNMIADGVTEFIEFGPGEVLCGMLKRIDKTVPARRFSVN